MPGYGEIAAYGDLSYKQDFARAQALENKINAQTGRCFRYAVKPDEGQGFSIYGNGTNWIWPDPYSDSLTVLDVLDQPRYIVFDEITGLAWEIGTRNGPANSGLVASWLDKLNDYGGAEIPTSTKYKEQRADMEHKRVEHLESHVYMRPHFEEDGFREAFGVNMRFFVDGSLVPDARIQDVPLDGDLVSNRRLEGNRIQEQIDTLTSFFRAVGSTQYFIMKDDAKSRVKLTEANQQAELGAPRLWFSRGPNLILNRAIGTDATGSIFAPVIGPDGLTESGMSFSPATGLATTIGKLGDFTIIFSMSSISDAEIMTIGNLAINIDQEGDEFIVDVNGIRQDLTWHGAGWTTVMLRRRGSDLAFFENGRILNTRNFNTDEFEGTVNIMNRQEGDLFDLRVYDSGISDGAFLYYHRDLSENLGRILLPIW